jgi:outer membrane lipoprotein-sorting protein
MRFGLKGSVGPLFAAFILLAGIGVKGAAAQSVPTLDTVLSKMDAVSQSFTSVEASLERVEYTFFADTTLTDRGKLFMARAGKETRVRYDIKTPREETTVIDKGRVVQFNPKSKQPATVRNVDPKNLDLLEFLLVGFGQSRADILRLYDSSIGGTETVGAKKAVVLDLKPKESSGIADDIASIRLWLDPDRWIPVRTRIVLPSKNTWTIGYTDVKLGGVSGSVFEVKQQIAVKAPTGNK